MRRGQPVPSGSQADSAYDRYAMGKQAYHAPANDGCDDWDESFPTAASQLTNYKQPRAYRRPTTAPYKHSNGASGKIRAITPATAANSSPGSPTPHPVGSPEDPRHHPRRRGQSRARSDVPQRSQQHEDAYGAPAGESRSYMGGGASYMGGGMSHMSGDISMADDQEGSHRGHNGQRRQSGTPSSRARSQQQERSTPLSSHQGRYKGGGTPSGQSMGSTDHLVAPRRSPMGRKPPPVEAYSSSMPGMGMGSTDHLVAPRRSPMGRRPPASMSVRSADTGMAAASEPLNLAPPSAAPRNVPVPASERRDKSRSSSVAGSAPRYGSAAAPRSAMRDARPQRAQHAQQEEQEITTAPAASAARRIPGVQEEPQVRRGGGRRGSNQEGSHGKHKSGSVPLGAFLTALNKEEAKEHTGDEYSATARIVLESHAAQSVHSAASAPVRAAAPHLFVPNDDPTPVRSKIVPDRKLAAKRAARGQSSSGSVPLGAFLNVLSHKEGTKKKPVPPEENDEEILPEMRGRSAATAPLRQQQAAHLSPNPRPNTRRPSTPIMTGGDDHVINPSQRNQSPMPVKRNGTMERQMAEHIVPRSSRSPNPRSASCGPMPRGMFDPAHAATAAVGDDGDHYLPALASNRKSAAAKGASAALSASHSGALSQPLGAPLSPTSPWGGGGGSGSVNAARQTRNVPGMNALSAPERSRAGLAAFKTRSSEEETAPEESIPEEASDREREEFVHSSMRGKLAPAAATFVLQDPSEEDAVGLRAYSGRNQMHVAAKRAMVDLRLDAPSSGPMGPHPAEQALAQRLKQPGPHARNVQEAGANVWGADRDATSQLESVAPHRTPVDDRECFNSMSDIDGSEIEDVESLCERLSCGRKVKTINLNGHSIQQPPPPSTPPSSPWRKVALWPVQGEVCSTAINNGLFSLVRSSPRDTLCITTGSGAKVTTGNISLRSHSCIVFDDTCSGMLISNLTIRDGVVLCHGKGCQVTFTNVTFERCTLVALEGAAATLHSCHFKNSSRQEGVSIYASGTGTAVNVRGGSITGGAQGASVSGGASLKAAFLTVTKVAVTGLEVRDASSSLHLSACSVSDFPGTHCDGAGVRAVLVLSHASAELHGLTVRDVECGVVIGMASANIMNCDVSNTSESCIAFRAGATGKVENCVLARSRSRHGLYASGGGTNVEAQNCRFVDNKEAGAAANHGGYVLLNLCETQRNALGGVMVLRNASIKATDCTSFDDEVGLGACEGGQVVGEHVTVQGSGHACYSIAAGSSAKLQDCVAADGKDVGFHISGKNSVANLVRCEVRTCVQSGVGVLDGAVATLERVLVEGSRGGDGVRVEGPGAQMQAKECRILRCQMHGVLACMGGSAELTQCETKQNKASGFSVEDKGSHITLGACASDFDAQGCGAGAGGKLTARNVAVCDSQCSGFRVWGGASADLQACKVTKCGDTGVLATDPSSSLLMMECAVMEGLHACVGLGTGAKGELRDCVLSSSGLDGVAAYGEGTEVDARNCKLMENEQCGAFVGDKAKMRLQGCQSTCNRSDGFCAERGGSLKLSRCTSDSDRCGCVGTGSVMELEEVAVTRSVACGFVFREATSAIMKECTAMACGTNGVEVGSEAQVAIEGGAVRGNYDLGVVVGMASRSVLKGVRSSENGICGFKCTLSGKLLLVGCESGDSTPYLRAQGGSMQCQGCKPDMAAAESDGVSQEMTSDMVDDMLGDMLGAFQALLNDPLPEHTQEHTQEAV